MNICSTIFFARNILYFSCVGDLFHISASSMFIGNVEEARNGAEDKYLFFKARTLFTRCGKLFDEVILFILLVKK